MRRTVRIGFVCLWAAVTVLAQVVVQGGGGSPTNIPPGAAIWYGVGSPAGTAGADGDYYVDTNSYCLYGPKAQGAWPSSCVSSVRQLGYVAENVGNKGAAGGYAPLDSNARVPAANLPPATAVNGTSVPPNSGSDQTMVTTAPAVGSWTALPACPDTGGNHLNYSVVTHGFVCGNTGGTAGSVDFGGVGDGTNANSLLVSGSLSYTGSGFVNANQISGVPLAGLATGLLKLTTGTGVPSIAASADIANTLGYTPENPAYKGLPNGYAPLDGSQKVPLSNLPPIPYSQTSGVQAALTYTPEDAANRNAPGGYAPLDSGTHLPAANMPALAGDLVSAAGSANVVVGTVLGGQTPVTNASIAGGTLPAAFTDVQAAGSAQFGSGTYQSTVTSALTANRSWVVPDFSGTMVMNGSVYAAGGGTAQAQTANLPGPVASYAAGMQVEWLPVAANTGPAPTLNVNSLGALTITRCGGAALAAGDLATTAVAFAVYDGTYLELQNPQASACAGPAAAQLPNTTLMTEFAGNANGSALAAGSSYLGVGIASGSATEASRSNIVAAACTLRTFRLITTATNSTGGSIVVTLRVNQATPSGGPTITINNNDTAQAYSDTSHTAYLPAAATWDVLVQNNGSSTYSGLAGWSVGCLPN